MGGAVAKQNLPKALIPEKNLEIKIVEAMQQRESKGTSIKSFNSIILKFPKIDTSLRKCKATFQQFDEDANGVIDRQELKNCFRELKINFTEEEVSGLFEACDISDEMGMKFSEFIVLLCLVYLLKQDPTGLHVVSKITTFGMGLPDLESTFETLVDAFVFLDKNHDGHVSRREMVEAINETTSGGRSSGRIAMRRFEEMDWDKNGMVNFKEFLFAFTRWIGIDNDDEEDDSVA